MPSPSSIYTVGGSLMQDAPSYVVRQADQQFYQALSAGDLCYLFNARQMGKSSLRLQTMARLERDGKRCIAIDMTAIGSQDITVEQWYGAIATTIVTDWGEDLMDFLDGWWQVHGAMPPVGRFAFFLKDWLMPRVTGSIVIFFDEIDSLLSLPFSTDDFFALLRSHHESRTTQALARRLTFALIGVATPSNLIHDRQRTPFNIGQAIALEGFTLSETPPLQRGLRSQKPAETMAEILHWTGGQPFLTQKLCRLQCQYAEPLAQLVQRHVIDRWEVQDEPTHLRTIRDRLLGQEQYASRLLDLYRSLLQAEHQRLAVEESEIQQQLCLSGLTVVRGGWLQIYNPIYAAVFDLPWVERELSNLCPYITQLKAWHSAQERDNSRLLRGNTLQEALVWASDRNLSRLERRYLQASQDEELADVVRSKTILEVAQVKARKLLSRGKAMLALALLALMGIFYLLYQTHEINWLESQSNQSLSRFEFAPIEMLREAIGTATKFQQHLNWMKFLQQDVGTTVPQLVLQKMVDNMQVSDEIKTYQTGINTVRFFSGGSQMMTAGSDGTVVTWDWDQWNPGTKSRQLDRLQLPVTVQSQLSGTRLRPNVKSLRLGKGGDRFITGSNDGYLRLWGGDPRKTQPRQVAEVAAHGGGVYNVRFSPDEKTIATSGETDGKIKLWSLDGNQLNLQWETAEPHQEGILGLNFSPNGQFLASAGKDGEARLWDLGGHLVRKLMVPEVGRGTVPVNSITFCEAKDCRYAIATSQDDGMVNLWDSQGNLLQRLSAHTGNIRITRFSPDGRVLATASSHDPSLPNGSMVRLWSLPDLALVAEFKGHQGDIETLGFLGEDCGLGRCKLATAGKQDSIVRLWNVPNVAQFEQQLVDRHGGKTAAMTANTVRFSPDARYVISGGTDGTLRWWERWEDPLTREARLKRLTTFESEGSRAFISARVHGRSPQVLPNYPDNHLIVVGDSLGDLRLLRWAGGDLLPLGQPFNTDQGRIDSIDLSAIDYLTDRRLPRDHMLVATVGEGSTSVKVWDIDLKTFEHRLVYSVDCGHQPKSVRFNPKRLQLAIGTYEQHVVVVDLEVVPDGLRGRLQDWAAVTDGGPGYVLLGYSADGQSLVSSSQSGLIQRWDAKGQPMGAEINTYQVGTNNVVNMNPKGQLVTVGAGGAIRLWDQMGRQLADFRRTRVDGLGFLSSGLSVKISDDGKWLITGGDDGIPRLWPLDRDLSRLIEQGCERLPRISSEGLAGCRSKG